ncbi:MAG: hypothetical protein WAZ14_03330 [Patescibacteria group bacterium]
MYKQHISKLAIAGLGSLVALVVAVPVTYEITSRGALSQRFYPTPMTTTPEIQTLPATAFGNLTEYASSNTTDASSISARQPAGLGGGGTTTMSEDAKLIAPGTSIVIGEPYPGNIVEYTYTYTGTDLDLSSVSDAVYRKRGGLNLGNAGADLARGTFGPVNLNGFSGLELQNFSLTQTDDNGYSIYIDPINSSISINGNSGFWNYTDSVYTPVSAAELLPEEQLISIAGKFLNSHNISTTDFGDPVVDQRGLAYALSQPVDLRYLPEVMNVTYPILIEGQPTFTSDGSAYGLYVSVNIRTQTVTNVSINIASAYDKSSYELERDPATILKYAAQGGLYDYASEGVTETVNIELGTPEVILINYYTYQNNVSESLFIPALSFPITKNSDTYPVYSEQVVIPLVKSIIEEANQTPIYRIL